MTNFHYLEDAMKEIQHVMTYAEEQLIESKRVEPGNPDDFTNAQLQLEQANMEVETLLKSAAQEQRDDLFRLQQRIHQLQNKMILGL